MCLRSWFPWSCCILIVVFWLAGCGDEQPLSASKSTDWDEVLAKAEQRREAIAAKESVSYGGVDVSISPAAPFSGTCLKAEVTGNPANRTVRWEINGATMQMGESTHFCLPDVRKGDEVSVFVGDENAGATTSVKVGNSPPRIIDTTIEMVSEKDETYILVTPQIEDADDDVITVTYQWRVNGEVLEDHSGDRLPVTAYQPADSVKVILVASDGTVSTQPYQTNEVAALGAAPIIISSPVTSFKTLDYTYQVEAIDPDGGTLEYSLQEAPDGMQIDRRSGLISWSLRGVQADEYRVVILVEDSDGDQSRQEYVLTLRPPE